MAVVLLVHHGIICVFYSCAFDNILRPRELTRLKKRGCGDGAAEDPPEDQAAREGGARAHPRPRQRRQDDRREEVRSHFL